MGVKRKRYLQLAADSNTPRDRLFYKLMAAVSEEFSELFMRNVNQVGATVIYDIALRSTSALLMETALNLGGGTIDVDRLCADFRTAALHACEMQRVIGEAPCTPKMDA